MKKEKGWKLEFGITEFKGVIIIIIVIVMIRKNNQ